MEIRNMTMEQVVARLAEIRSLVDQPDADLEALDQEVTELEARKSELEARAAQRAALEARVRSTGATSRTFNDDNTAGGQMEVRNSPEYIRAFANYIRTEDDSECRALLTENVSGGSVPVPDLVEETIRTAWEREGIMRRVRRTYLKGNLRIGFELSAEGALDHVEGAVAPKEEDLVLGVVELVPASIKKWITLSDEVLDMDDGSFLRYIYDEVTYQIAKKAAANLVAKIVAADTVSTSTAVGIPVLAASPIGIGTVATALGYLSDAASDVVIIMNRQTEAAFKDVQYNNKYAVDIFEGLDREYTSALKAFSAASSGDTYAIIGDLGAGAHANFPNGDDIKFKFDDLSLAEKDLVKIVGREFVGMGVVGPGCFVKITK